MCLRVRMIDLHEINLIFQQIFFNVGYDGYKTIETDNFFYVSEFYYNNPKSLEFCKNVISGVDDGIINIEIESTHDSKSGDTIYYPIFIHSYNESELRIGLDQESMGTKALFLSLYKYWLVLNDGALLVFDEFDTHLHPMILPEIIKLFQNNTINRNNAQLIITAHNTEIIDSLGRYSTVLVNKENNESYCYRLDEISLIRNDRSISPIYRKGKIGGIPRKIQGLTSRIVTEMENK